jgi:hypothetical protein
MYLMAGLLVIGFVCNMLVRPVRQPTSPEVADVH